MPVLTRPGLDPVDVTGARIGEARLALVDLGRGAR
jgi:hypothetical protein